MSSVPSGLSLVLPKGQESPVFSLSESEFSSYVNLEKRLEYGQHELRSAPVIGGLLIVSSAYREAAYCEGSF